MSDKRQSTSPRRDHRQEMTDSIIAALEKGVPPWRKSWQSGSLEMPLNPISGKAYRGGNVLNLMLTSVKNSYDDPRWVTYRQAQEKGWQVRKGEHGTQIEFWKNIDAKDVRGLPDTKDRERFICRFYTVFNACQIDGIPEREKPVRNEWQAVQSGESILRNSGAVIIHSQDSKAFYKKTTDTIHLPFKTSFHDAAGYYGTALHELAHWSGAKDRLNRETLTESVSFGDPTYAREELRAELASVFLAAERGIPCDLDNNAAYMGSWLKALREDRNEIFRAARDAHKATDFLLALELNRSLEDALAIADGHLPAVTNAPSVERTDEAASAVFESPVNPRTPSTTKTGMEM